MGGEGTGAGSEQADTGKRCCESIQKTIADRLQQVAESLGKTAEGQDESSGIAQFETHAAEWLNHSAEYVRQFDYEQESAKVKDEVVQNPGRSLLIAGAVGLVLGVLLRR